MLCNDYPRIVIAGLSGDSGKTIVTCGLLAHFKSREIEVSGFKKGPDYVDTAWLSLASDKPARNLDTFMMGFSTVKKAFVTHASPGYRNGINIIEGNRGLFDGVDAKGKHSTAELARLLESPVIIVQNISKVTRTAAAFIAGCLSLGPGLNIEGVILNNVAGERHSRIAREAIEAETGIPVVGIIPRLSDKYVLPSRHLGLVMPGEMDRGAKITGELAKIIEEHTDISKVLEIAQNAPYLVPDKEKPQKAGASDERKIRKPAKTATPKVKIGYLKDKSFSFYYPENLEMLTEAGAEVIAVTSNSPALNELDALYIGGGFPEMNLAELASDREMIKSVNRLIHKGLPVYAECGGLMYLARKVKWNGIEYPLAGVLPIEIRMNDKPQGHGYSEAVIDRENPFFKPGTKIRGHEFHYSNISYHDPGLKSCFSVTRGRGSFDSRDGLLYKNVLASYIHIHALANPEWVSGMIRSAINYKNSSKRDRLLEV